MWYEDLSACDYAALSNLDSDAHVMAIGWLERGRPFATGTIDREVYLRLIELLKEPWQFFFMGGVHECDLCQFKGEARGGANVFIPFGKKIYVSPSLITHYINAHQYRPPKEFCDAVIACPTMRSLEYLRALRAAGGSAFAQILRPNSPVSDPRI